MVNAVILVNQTKEIWRDFTRFAIISKPNIQITQNKNPVEANYIAYHIIVNFFKTDIQLSQKKNAPLMMHAVYCGYAQGAFTLLHHRALYVLLVVFKCGS